LRGDIDGIEDHRSSWMASISSGSPPSARRNSA
jgi:hypothetical protein